jgi:hypothetical protein
METKENPPVAYQLSTSEQLVIEKYLERSKAETPVPRLKVMEDGTSFSVDHPNQGVGWALILERLGTPNLDFGRGLITQLSGMCSDGEGKIIEWKLNFAFSVVTEMRPNDQLQASLATQIASVQMAMSKAGNQLVQAETFPEQESAERMYNKLVRNYAILLDNFTRYRAQGGQNVTVQNNNVLVGDGGQAIVANMNAPHGGVPGQTPQGKVSGTDGELTRSH